MKIEICEDNGFMNDGVPTLVVLLVTMDNGKHTRVPYQADKTIQELYADVQKIKEPPLVYNGDKQLPLDYNPANIIFPLESNMPKFSNSKTIEREDIVKVTNLKLDLDGNPNPELTVGEEYRVVSIIRSNGVIKYYELMNDKKDDKLRIPCFPSEVELVRKFVPPPPRREGIFEITKKCICGEVNALELNGDVYQGTCDKCGTKIEERRGLRV